MPACVGDVVGAHGACEQSVMADVVKTCWQDMEEEAADELVCRECHERVPLGTLDPVVFVFERDAHRARRRTGVGRPLQRALRRSDRDLPAYFDDAVAWKTEEIADVHGVSHHRGKENLLPFG